MPAHMTATVRCAPKKPAKGTAQKATRARRRRITRAERDAKEAAKIRDMFMCRRCGTWRGQMEAAHIDDKGMGGDHGLRSSLPSDYVTLCTECHRGHDGLHGGRLRLVVGPLRGDGPVMFRCSSWGSEC